MPASALRLALIGWGAIGQTVAAALAEQNLDVAIVAVGVRDRSVVRVGIPEGALVIDDADQLLATRPNLVIEAAGLHSVAAWGKAALNAGADYVVSSVSAFADAELLERLKYRAVANGRQLIIQPGALAGIDALAAATHMGVDHVEHRIIKPPRAWAGTGAEKLCNLANIDEPAIFYSDTASATATAFPKNANVAMTTALAGIGPDRTTITLVADPEATRNRHEITASGAFGEMEISIANSPLATNPKTSAMAALALVRLIQNRACALVI